MDDDSNCTERRNKYGEIGYPCLTPLDKSNLDEVPFFNLIEQLQLLKWVLIYFAQHISKYFLWLKNKLVL